MNKAVPWSIKGIDVDTREAAKEAARRDGLSLGEWINRAIAERAGDASAPDDDYDADARLEEVAAQLARLGGESSRAEPLRRRSGDAPRRAAAPRHDETQDFSDWASAPAPRPARGKPAARPRANAFDGSAGMLEEAVASFDKRGGRVETDAARAIEKAAEMLEAAEAERAEQLAAMEDKLTGLASRLRRKSGGDDSRGLRDVLERLDGKIENLSRRRPEPEEDPALRTLDRKLSHILARLEKVEETPAGAPRDAQFSRLEKRFDALLSRLERPAAPPQSFAPQAAQPAAQPAALWPPAPRGLDGMVAEISARQRELDGGRARSRPAAPAFGGHDRTAAMLDARFEALARKLDQTAQRVEAPREDGRIDRLQLGIESLSSRLEEMRRDFTTKQNRETGPSVDAAMRDLASRVDSARDTIIKAADTRRTANSAEIEALSHQVQSMARALADVAPRSQMAALENAVRALGDRIVRSRDEGMREAVLAPIEALAADVRRALSEAGATANFDGVAKLLREVEGQVEDLRRAGGADRADFNRVLDQSDELRAMIASAVEQVAPLERMEQQVGDLAGRLETLARQTHDASLAQQAGLEQSAAGWRGVEARLDDLAARMERKAPETAHDSRFEDISRRLEYVHQALAARIDGAQGDAAQNSGAQLEPLLRSLADKMEKAMLPQAGAGALAALEQQMQRVSERLERGDGASSVKLERAIDELAERLERNREFTQDIAESAARQALREALSSLPQAGGDPNAAREIADLRQKQENSDRRAQQTLSAVHETLEKVVDRLALIEEDAMHGGALRPPGQGAPFAIPGADPRANGFLREPGAGRASDGQRPEPPELADLGALGALSDSRFGAPGRDEAPAGKSGPANHIEAARRALAARAAAEAADKELADKQKRARGGAASAASAAERVAAFVRPLAAGEKPQGVKAAGGSNVRRLPALLSMAGLVLALGAYQAYRIFDSHPAPVPQAAPMAPETAKVPSPAPSAAAPVAPAPEAAAPAAPPVNVAPAAPVPPMAPGVAPGAKPQHGASLIDPMAVGAIGARGATIASVQAGAQFAQLKAGAEKGDAVAQFELGSRLVEGRGIARDPAAAIVWLEKASAQGLPQAQYRLGAIYEKGVGAARDLYKARDHYVKAAQQGHVRAMHNLAVIEAEGVEGKPDYTDAAQWFRRAADFGVRDSQFNLAILYARGMGVTQNMAQSYVWFAAAAAQGDEDAAKKRDEVAARLDAATLDAAKKQAAAYRPRPVSQAVNEPPAIGAPQAASKM